MKVKKMIEEYVSPLTKYLEIGFEGVLCSSTMDTSFENYFGLSDQQQDIF
jgi:hypothetical protein